MLVIKVGGSIFAPKNNNEFDREYLRSLKSKLEKNYLGIIILIHGTGNIGHGFVKKYGITTETYTHFSEVRNNFFLKMEEIFKGYIRISGENILSLGKTCIEGKGNIISGGDAYRETCEIIGSDDLFGKLIEGEKEELSIILTDVDGVFDNNGEVIPLLKLSEIENISFWKKQGDVTNGMEGKLQALKKYIHPSSKGVWICNGFDLKNVEKILKIGKGKGTLIML